MQRLLTAALLILVAACGSQANDDSTPTATNPVVRTFGPGVSAGEIIPLADVLKDPAAYLGATLRVEGMAVDVCESRGCWFDLAAGNDGGYITFKVQDGAMVFPPEIKGESMRAEGVMVALEFDLEDTREILAGRAHPDEPFDPASVTEGMTVYRLDGIGAEQLGGR